MSEWTPNSSYPPDPAQGPPPQQPPYASTVPSQTPYPQLPHHPDPLQQPAPYTHIHRRKTEDLFLNILLYLGSLLLIGAAALFITSTTENAPVRVVALGSGSLLFYAAGLITYAKVVRIRIASYSFTATGLALLPLTGIAVYLLGVWSNGPMIWLFTSLIGTGAIILACSLMHNRVMGYLLVSFFVSDALAATNIAELPFVWYFVIITLLATMLGLLLHLKASLVPAGLREGIVEASRIFVPVTSVVVFFFVANMSLSQLGLVFTIMSVHSLVFFSLETKVDYYIQLRLYPIIAVGYFGFAFPNTPLALTAIFLAILLSSILAVQLAYRPLNARLKNTVRGTYISEWLFPTDIVLSLVAQLVALLVASATLTGHRSVEQGILARFLPYFEDKHLGGILPAAWVLGVIFIMCVLVYRRHITSNVLIIFLYCATALLALIGLRRDGAFYLLFALVVPLMVLGRDPKVEQLVISIGAKISIFLGLMHISYICFPDFEARGILLLTAGIITVIGFISATLASTGPQEKTRSRILKTFAYATIATALFSLRSMLDFRYKEETTEIITTVLYGAILLALVILCIWLMRLARSVHMGTVIGARLILGIALGFAALAAIVMPYYWIAIIMLTVTGLVMTFLAFAVVPRQLSDRGFINNAARLLICWSVVVLLASDSIKLSEGLLVFSGVCLVLGTMGAIQYYRSSSRLDLGSYWVIFYGACIPPLITGYALGREAPLASLLCPTAVLILWIIGERAGIFYLRMGAGLALVFILQSSADIILNPSFTRPVRSPIGILLDAPSVFGLSAALATILLFVGKTLLPLEVPGHSPHRPNISVQLPTDPPRIVTLPMHGPLPSPKARFKKQTASFIDRACLSGNSSIMIPGMLALFFYSLTSFISPNILTNAFICALLTLSFVTVIPKNNVYIIPMLAVVIFIGRVLLALETGSAFLSFAEIFVLIVLSISGAPVLRNLIMQREAKHGIDASVVGLYITFCLQGLVTLYVWASDKIPATQGTVILIITLLMTVLAVVLVDRIWVFIGAALVTINLAQLLGQLNPLVLMIIAVIIISGVVWRLLTRDTKKLPAGNAPAPTGAPGDTPPPHYAPEQQAAPGYNQQYGNGQQYGQTQLPYYGQYPPQ